MFHEAVKAIPWKGSTGDWANALAAAQMAADCPW